MHPKQDESHSSQKSTRFNESESGDAMGDHPQPINEKVAYDGKIQFLTDEQIKADAIAAAPNAKTSSFGKYPEKEGLLVAGGKVSPDHHGSHSQEPTNPEPTTRAMTDGQLKDQRSRAASYAFDGTAAADHQTRVMSDESLKDQRVRAASYAFDGTMASTDQPIVIKDEEIKQDQRSRAASYAAASSAIRFNMQPPRSTEPSRSQVLHVGAVPMVPRNPNPAPRSYSAPPGASNPSVDFSDIIADAEAPSTREGATTAMNQDDTLFSAQLVVEESDDGIQGPFVEAEPAPEGFKALMENKRFKWAVGALMVAILIVVIPVSIVVPQKAAENAETKIIEVPTNRTNGTECGTIRTGQADYRGSINVTAGGVPCIRWDDPRRNHDYTPENYPDADLDNNYCRNPSGSEFAWCYPDPEYSSTGVICDVPFCDAKAVDLRTDCGTVLDLGQGDYRGRVNVTRSGIPCQAWSEQYPHGHTRTPENYPDAGLEGNYCRNPDGEALAWCYSTISGVRWEYCDVPFCEVVDAVTTDDEGNNENDSGLDECFNCTPQECGTLGISQADYLGNISVSRSGRPCLPWGDVSQNSELVNHSFCRKPGTGWDVDRNADRAFCLVDPDNMRRDAQFEDCNVPKCVHYDFNSCGTYDRLQADYRGTKNTTKSGRACQRWDSQFPHIHVLDSPGLKPEANLIENYCRNPDGHAGGAWCYTTDEEKRFEECDVDWCGGPRVLHCGSREQNQGDYRGTLAVTKSGRKCQHWEDNYPHKHSLHAFERPESGLKENFCRNPTGEGDTAWCFTADLLQRREECEVPFCDECDPNDWSSCGAEEDKGIQCHNCTTLQCGTLDLKQSDYRGDINVTNGGIPCQAWNVQEPQGHSRTPENYPDSGLSGNFCRNPDGEDGAWCYTTDPAKRWDYCPVPSCA